MNLMKRLTRLCGIGNIMNKCCLCRNREPIICRIILERNGKSEYNMPVCEKCYYAVLQKTYELDPINQKVDAG